MSRITPVLTASLLALSISMPAQAGGDHGWRGHGGRVDRWDHRGVVHPGYGHPHRHHGHRHGHRSVVGPLIVGGLIGAALIGASAHAQSAPTVVHGMVPVPGPVAVPVPVLPPPPSHLIPAAPVPPAPFYGGPVGASVGAPVVPVAPAARVQYYCAPYRAHYPYVASCPEPWYVMPQH